MGINNPVFAKPQNTIYLEKTYYLMKKKKTSGKTGKQFCRNQA